MKRLSRVSHVKSSATNTMRVRFELRPDLSAEEILI